MDDAHTKTASKVLKDLKVDGDKGLSEKEAAVRLTTYGKNELAQEEHTPLWELIVEQFKDQLVIILIGAAVISFILAFLESDGSDIGTAYVEPIVILLILIANATVGVIQETNAEKAIDALKEYSPDETNVIRDGHMYKVETSLLVPGDIISLSVGDKIPADARVLEILSASFSIDQSILTGEPISVPKYSDVVVKDSRSVKQDRVNMLFSGTTVTVGKCNAIVVLTGANTAIGEIHEFISEKTDEKTPLKIALDEFGDQLAKVITVICILVWLINIRHFNDESFHGNWVKGAVYYFKIAVALAVAAIPEGLAVIITTCLALGTKKMANQGAIVRKLRSVETLGCTSIICSDKTGTLTTNQMSVRRVAVIDSKSGSFFELDVDGTTYNTVGEIHHKESPIDRQAVLSLPTISDLSLISTLCNDSKLFFDHVSGNTHKIGEPTEAALKTFVEKLGFDDDSVLNLPFSEEEWDELTPDEKFVRVTAVSDRLEEKYSKKVTLEFARDRKSMSVLVDESSGSKKRGTGLSGKLLVKGAPEQILDRCTKIKTNNGVINLTPTLKKSIIKKFYSWGEDEALRVLGFAIKDDVELPSKFVPDDYVNFEQDLTFIGLVGMLDPPRPEVAESISECHAAGIKVIVITGDNKKTAERICREIGIFDADEDLTGLSFTGREFDDMTKEEKIHAVTHASLFSRTDPSHKQQLVDLLKNLNFVVAMTGDGVNDAPALKKADIGVAMGTGTDVAKLAADMVLADDNFSTIVRAVEEGRAIYSNTKQFIRYLISSNIGEVVSIFLTVVLGMPEALIPVQLLWVNLVTDGLPATALGFNPSDNNIMHRPPRNSKEPIVTKWLFIRYMIIGTYVGVATVFGYAWWFIYFSEGPKITFEQLSNFHKCSTNFPQIGCEMFSDVRSQRATTISLSILVVVEMLNAINSLSENESLLTFPVWKNLYLVGAVILSMALHFAILYIPFLSSVFSIFPLTYDEWKGVLYISFPVIIIDEILKLVSRVYIIPNTDKKLIESRLKQE